MQLSGMGTDASVLLEFSYICLDSLDLFDWSFQSAPNLVLQSPWNALFVCLSLQNLCLWQCFPVIRVSSRQK